VHISELVDKMINYLNTSR